MIIEGGHKELGQKGIFISDIQQGSLAFKVCIREKLEIKDLRHTNTAMFSSIRAALGSVR